MTGLDRAVCVVVLAWAAVACVADPAGDAHQAPGSEPAGPAGSDGLLAGSGGGGGRGSGDGGSVGGVVVDGGADGVVAEDAGAANAGSGGYALTRVAPELLHRLNRAEYNNTVRDLLGTSLTPADSFPPDSNLDAFDNLAEGLSLSPTLMALYVDAARALAEDALRVTARYHEHFDANALGAAPGYASGASAFALASSTLAAKLTLPQAETVTLSVPAGGTFNQAPAPIMSLQVDALPAQTFTVTAQPSAPQTFSVKLALAAGTHTVQVKCSNYINKPSQDITNQLVVSFIAAEGDARVVPKARAKIYLCEPAQEADPAGCYERIIVSFAARAFRRALSSVETESLTALWQRLRQQEGDDEALMLVVRSLLISPNFLYRPSFSLPGAVEPNARGLLPLDDYTLANRLSYFLWSSMPDDGLFASAHAGALQTDAGVSSAVDRMLADPKASALEVGFAAQWLNGRAVSLVAKDPSVYPDFDEPLRSAMAGEVQQFFGAFRNSDLPLQRMLDPGFGFVNDRLARHYGLPLPGSADLKRVTLPAGARGGILFQGAWLTASSEANRTSPVKRGRFLLERILCRSVPPPPPNVPAFVPESGVTMRERLAQHRKSPACAGCHNLLDPVGLGLEELDGIGSLRSLEAGSAVNTSGALPETDASSVADVPYSGGSELVARLKEDPRFERCLTQKLYSYALGRELSKDDEPDWQQLAAGQTVRTSLPELVRSIALSVAFRMRDNSEVAQ